MSTNRERVRRAEGLLTSYQELTGLDRDDFESAVKDLLSDLHHFAFSKGINITKALKQAKEFYREEIEEAGWGAEDL